ncbi:MAG: nicotinate phosphoribosyltransferase [Chloroflexi bacterium]|nr:nicotinate phosphoribosyltransferase [Chloroflexota bacterium]
MASFDDIKAGKVTDVYFARTVEILKAKGIDKRVKAEFIAKGLPEDWDWAILAGIDEARELLSTLKVSSRAMLEGTVFGPLQPVMEIEGPYLNFAVFETALLGMLCQASGVATRAARCRKVAGERTLISFGARRMHPALAPMIERAAFIGGCDSVSVILSAEVIGEKPSGTMPHALILVMGSTVAATRAFHEVFSPAVKTVSLIDTFNDEKFEALNVAEALGPDLFAVRLDTPASRRGSFYRILEEVRWELDLRGFKHVKLFVSGGIDEEKMVELNPLVDAYGVGTTISNAPVVDLALDITEIEGKPIAKRGKWSGAKSVWRCPQCFTDTITPYGWAPPECPCGGQPEDLLRPLTVLGQPAYQPPRPREIRRYVLEQLEHLPVPIPGG